MKFQPTEKHKFLSILFLLQLCVFIAFGIQSTYAPSANAGNAEHNLGKENDLEHYYSMFQDVHIMVFIGFGFLMTFLKRYGYSAVGLNFLIAVVSMEWAFLFKSSWKTNLSITVEDFIHADFAAATVLISFGAVLGKLNPTQLTVMAVWEVGMAILNEWICSHLYVIVDVGGSMIIHTFGAYFGLAVAWAIGRKSQQHHPSEAASYNSNLFAMIGTIFLWMCWPSFNAALAIGDDRHRAVINTILSLGASCVAAFFVSSLVSKENKFDMVHVQNSTLAGGVAIGAVADLMVQPIGALVIGTIAGVLSVFGYRYLQPFLMSKAGLHDTCGVHNLHGIPGIIGGLSSIVAAAYVSRDVYGLSVYQLFPKMAPSAANATNLDAELAAVLGHSVSFGDDRSALTQSGYQAAALATTMGIALMSGAVIGIFLRLSCWSSGDQSWIYDDQHHWEVPAEPQSYSQVSTERIEVKRQSKEEPIAVELKSRLLAGKENA